MGVQKYIYIESKKRRSVYVVLPEETGGKIAERSLQEIFLEHIHFLEENKKHTSPFFTKCS
jgi:hypothetical protein